MESNWIDQVIASTAVRAGTPSMWVAKRTGLMIWSTRKTYNRMPPWTAEEKRFLIEKTGYMADEEIGAHLGRSVNAIHVKRVRWQIPGPTRRAGWVSTHIAAHALGMDEHSIAKLVKRGLFPAEHVPGRTAILVLRAVTLCRWATRPEHWIYFRVERMGDPHLQRLVTLAQARWGDEWWPIGKAAAYHGVTCGAMNRACLTGRLPGIDWGNWYVRASDAKAYPIRPGKGSAVRGAWTARSDAFMLRMRADGKGPVEIGRMMGWTSQRVSYRLYILNQTGNTVSTETAI